MYRQTGIAYCIIANAPASGWGRLVWSYGVRESLRFYWEFPSCIRSVQLWWPNKVPVSGLPSDSIHNNALGKEKQQYVLSLIKSTTNFMHFMGPSSTIAVVQRLFNGPNSWKTVTALFHKDYLLLCS